jgi:hypothetical protein
VASQIKVSLDFDLYNNTVDTNKLERIQRREARFITGDYKSREEVSVIKMLAELELELSNLNDLTTTSIRTS